LGCALGQRKEDPRIDQIGRDIERIEKANALSNQRFEEIHNRVFMLQSRIENQEKGLVILENRLREGLRASSKDRSLIR